MFKLLRLLPNGTKLIPSIQSSPLYTSGLLSSYYPPERYPFPRQHKKKPPPEFREVYDDLRAYPEDPIEAQETSKSVMADINNQIEQQSHGRLFAIVHVAGKQFKVTPEDIILVQGYWAPTVGDKIRLEKVLMTGCSDFTLFGRPLLPSDLVRVEATVIEKTLSNTKMHFVLKRRKNYQKLQLSKIPHTLVRINAIEFDGLVNERKDVEGLRNTPF